VYTALVKKQGKSCLTLLTLILLVIPQLFTAPLQAQSIDMSAVRGKEHFRWGVRAFHNGFLAEALLSFEKALSFQPDDRRTRLWLGDTLYRSGFEDAALKEYQYLLAAQPGDVLLTSKAELLSFRRGIGRVLEQESKYVVAHEINAAAEDFYPLRRPASVRISEDGSVYLAAFGSGEIVILDINDRVREVLGGGVKGFDRPFDVLNDGGRHLFVSEYGRNQIVKCTPDGKRVLEFGGRGSGPGKLLGPQFLAQDEKGYLYVTDWGNSRVSKYDRQGNFILSFGGRGSSARLRGPTGIAVREGLVYVADRSAARIAVFDPSGNFLSYLGEGLLTSPEGIAFRDSDRLVVADGNRLRQYQLSREMWTAVGEEITDGSGINQIAFNPNGDLYAADFDANRVYVLSEMSSLYAGLHVEVERIVSTDFPDVLVELAVEDRRGNPIIGLRAENFLLSENFRGLSDFTLARANTDPASLDVVVLAEKSRLIRPYLADLQSAAETIHTQVAGSSGGGGLRVITAGAEPVLAAEAGATRLVVREAVGKAGEAESRVWRFDLAARLAVSQLVPATGRKAVILLTQGRMEADAFGEYSLSEVAGYLRNNQIAFYAVTFAPEGPAGELEYLADETGGRCLPFYASEGLKNLIPSLEARRTPIYMLRYRSGSDPGFGENYIGFQAEVVLLRKSGRAESGYFPPLSD
jgi:DNA-binding beta-propeller fold protein YncE